MNGSAALECADPKSLGSTIGTGNLEVDLDKRLVMVDDNPGDIFLVRTAFQEEGIDVEFRVASSGPAAYYLFRRESRFPCRLPSCATNLAM